MYCMSFLVFIAEGMFELQRGLSWLQQVHIDVVSSSGEMGQCVGL